MVNSLFQQGDFHLHSGMNTKWKVDCDYLISDDWNTLTDIAVEKLQKVSFIAVHGIPSGGILLANRLSYHITYNSNHTLLIVDDVLTTGKSMEEARERWIFKYQKIIGLVVFARGPCPDWVTSIWQY